MSNNTIKTYTGYLAWFGSEISSLLTSILSFSTSFKASRCWRWSLSNSWSLLLANSLASSKSFWRSSNCTKRVHKKGILRTQIQGLAKNKILLGEYQLNNYFRDHRYPSFYLILPEKCNPPLIVSSIVIFIKYLF